MTRRNTYKPTDRSGDVLLRMTPEERTRLREMAMGAGKSVNEYVLRLIEREKRANPGWSRSNIGGANDQAAR